MQHYDGPAFFRQQGKNVPRVSPRQNTRENYHSLTGDDYRGPVYQGRNTKKAQSGTLHREYTTRTFKPKYVPPSTAQFTPNESRKKYTQLVKELAKTADSYLLWDEKPSDELIIDLTVPADQGPVRPVVTTETASDEKAQPEAEDTKVGMIDGAKTVAENQAVGHAVLDVEAGTTRPTPTPVSPTVDATGEPRALDRSLTDIMNAEQNDQRHLALFDEHRRQEQINQGKTAQTSQPKSSQNAMVKDMVDTPTPSGQPLVAPPVSEQVSKKAAIADPKDITNVQPAASEPTGDKQQFVYQFPPLSLLPEPVAVESSTMDEWVLNQIDVLNETLQSFHVDATVKDWTVGPTVTQFEVKLGRGVKVSKITNLTDDLKLALAAKDIRIEAPIPGKSSVGIEIPNLKSRPVMLAEVLEAPQFKQAQSPLTVALGVDLFGRPQVTDLQKMPHGLIAGATGSGKSVFINSLLVSLLYKAQPEEVKLLLIDPKAVEMAPYHDIPHLLAPVISDPQAAAAALKWVVNEMEERYQRLAAAGARNIEGFNEKAQAQGEYGLKMPYIVIVIDELADLMMVASSEVQDYIARITQKARAAGIHLLIATQRPSVDVITGTIKNNIPTRIAFMVASQVDSRTIIDTAGAERLLGRGDMLYLGNGASQPVRLQGTYINDEVDAVTDYVRRQARPHYAFDPTDLKKEISRTNSEDDLLPEVLDYIVNEDNISTSKLQRVFSIGYNRAANIIDDLEQQGLVSAAKGSKPRDVFLTPEKLAQFEDNSDLI
ncbi:DUF87 domain-containing protein [Ligilactobacillus saerimneri]|uniref:DNA translocase FtsK n=1 Tax=Ligilactobacillus saerimneri TaxID=228229 RepID=A0A7H9EJS7_9LACO|nr:DNA translocase FtsK [Ligilactobacillus saerimneri]QLL77699.1 DUF87 domain-containing protein [Ligilactobacillus saerimneri]